MKRSSDTARPDAGRVEESTGADAAVNYAMAAVLAAAAIAAAWYFKPALVLDPSSRDFNPFIGVPLFLGAFALKFLYSAVRATLLGKRFGASTLETEGAQARLGGTLKGRVRTSAPLAVEGDYAVTLKCIEEIVVESLTAPDKKRTESHVRWEGMRKVPAASINSAAGIPFEFPIPETAYAISDARARGTVFWTLEVRAPQKGMDYYASFAVAVGPKGG